MKISVYFNKESTMREREILLALNICLEFYESWKLISQSRTLKKQIRYRIMWKRIKSPCIFFFNYARSRAIKPSLEIKGDEQKRLSISSRNLLYKNRPTIRSAVLITTEVRICVPVNCYIWHGNHLAPEYPCCIVATVWLETQKNQPSHAY